MTDNRSGKNIIFYFEILPPFPSPPPLFRNTIFQPIFRREIPLLEYGTGMDNLAVHVKAALRSNSWVNKIGKGYLKLTTSFPIHKSCIPIPKSCVLMLKKFLNQNNNKITLLCLKHRILGMNVLQFTDIHKYYMHIYI